MNATLEQTLRDAKVQLRAVETALRVYDRQEEKLAELTQLVLRHSSAEVRVVGSWWLAIAKDSLRNDKEMLPEIKLPEQSEIPRKRRML